MESVERPLRADAERNRRRIMEAAAELFAERGLAVSMDDIAAHAGVGVATVYRRFPDKELLIDALFEARLDMLVATAEEALAHPDPWAGFVGFFERFLEVQAADRGVKEILSSSAHGAARVARARGRIVPVVTALVDRVQAAGELREDYHATDTPVLHIMLGAAFDFTHEVSPEAWRRYLVFLLDGLRPRRDGPTPLPVAPLDDDEVESAMRSWSPRRRR
jgi:AcrR family transcriptional regulator